MESEHPEMSERRGDGNLSSDKVVLQNSLSQESKATTNNNNKPLNADLMLNWTGSKPRMWMWKNDPVLN